MSDSGPSVPVAAGSPDPWNHDWTRGLFRALLYSALLPHECVCLCWGAPVHVWGVLAEAVWGSVAAATRDSTASVPSLPDPGVVP